MKATDNMSTQDLCKMLRISVDLAEAVINDKLASIQAALSKGIAKNNPK